MKLDLGCGANCREGYEGVDVVRVNEKVRHVHNLLSFPWPFETDSVEEIHTSHLIEHLPMLFWHPDRVAPATAPPSHRKVETAADFLISERNHMDSFEWTQHLTPFQVDEQSVDLLLKFFDECHRILKPSGTLEVVSPQAHSDRAFQDSTHRRFLVPTFYLYLDREWRRANGLEHAAYAVECDFPLGLGFIAHDYPDANQVRRFSDEANLARARHEWNFALDLRATLRKPLVGWREEQAKQQIQPASMTAPKEEAAPATAT